MLRLPAYLLIVGLVLAGCAASESVGGSSAPATPASPPPATSASVPAQISFTAVPRTAPPGSPAPRVLFVADNPAGDSGLTIMSEGSARRLFAAPDHAVIEYSVSPDYRRAAVVVSRTDRSDILVANLDGSGTTLLTDDTALEDHPTWSPDGKTLAFDSTADSNRPCDQQTCYSDIYTIGADGSNRRRLTTDPDADRLPAWSPDGTQIAFFRGCVNPANETCTPTLYVMHTDGSDQRIVKDATGAPIQVRYDTPPPSWSDDGQQLVAYLYRNGEPGAYTIPVAGGAPAKQYSFISKQNQGAIYEFGFRRSPDRSRVAFIQQVGECQVELCTQHIFVMNADGSDKRQLTRDGTYNKYPAWSPDGKELVFISDRKSTDPNRTWGMYTMDADGSHQQLLAENVDGYTQPLWLP